MGLANDWASLYNTNDSGRYLFMVFQTSMSLSMYIKYKKEFIFVVSLVFMLAGGVGNAAISKCQDANGKWHYGSSASQYCADSSEITKLDKRGVKVGQVEAVKTEEQLQAERKQQEEQEKRIEQQQFEKAERERILMVYQSEDDIERTKTKQINAIDQKISQHENYIIALNKNKEPLEQKKAATNSKKLITKLEGDIAEIDSKIAMSEQRIVELNAQKKEIEQKYDEDLATFQKYKNTK